jgi:branched-chain amino acid transport system ATP-binding protein
VLEIVDIHTYYGQSYILQGVSLQVREGAVMALLGRNGMGKTTTIRSIIGFTPPRRGRIRFQGTEIVGLQSYKIAKMGIGLVPQGRRIFPSLSVQQNLTMPARNKGKTSAWSLEKVYSFFPILKKRAKLGGNFLSGGEQQMLTIGRTLMTNPALLLMDEPSEGLAPLMVQLISQIMVQLKESDLSMLLVEQNIHMALTVADYVYIISKGAIVYESNPEEVRNNEGMKAKYLGATA